jgi:hypothetical protein
MFDDTDRRETAGGQTTLSHRREALAISRMDHRPRRFGSLTLVAGTVVVVIIALVIIGSTHHHSPNATGATRGSSATTGSTTGSRGSTATTGSSSTKGKTKGSSKTKAPTTTTTTLPASFAPEGGATALTATYATPSTFTLALDATVGNCWVNVTSLGGTSLLTQTIPAGQQKTVAVTGGATLVIGAPNAIHVLVQGRAVQLPPGYQTPFTMTFQPATSSQPGTSSQSGTSSSSTTTTTGG